MSKQTPLLFEVAWEVCHQVGGIYRVLSSKAASTVEQWGDRYCLLGPYTSRTSPTEFEPLTPGPIVGPAMDRLHERGMQLHFGRWLVKGYPKVLLFDYLAHLDGLDRHRQTVWDDLGIPAPPEDPETNDAIVFGAMVAEFLREFVSDQPEGQQVIAHFHEWMASVALSFLHAQGIRLATVFTTHATILGRHLCATGNDFYERLPRINVDHESGSRNIYHRYCIERAAANNADVFTTVSKVTADEAYHLLKRRPDVVLPNGLRVERFAAMHEFQNLHRRYKNRLHEFVRGHFFGSYQFDLDETIYVLHSGRYEYHNKGTDLFIEALWRLNRRLREEQPERTVVAFIVTDAPTKRVSSDVLRAHFMLQELRETCDTIARNVRDRIFESAAAGHIPEPTDLLDSEQIVLLKRMIFSRKESRPPTIVTHDMRHDNDDAILCHLRHRHLFNSPEDPVKVVYHPEFVSSTNPLFGMDYDQFVRGCHLGVFPSYYEPWGYTPAECTVLGIPSICSDLSGFGAFVQEHVEGHNQRGLLVLDRRDLGDEGAIEQLTQMMLDFAALDSRNRVNLRNKTERTSDLFDWETLGRYYTEARQLALARTYEELVKTPDG